MAIHLHHVFEDKSARQTTDSPSMTAEVPYVGLQFDVNVKDAKVNPLPGMVELLSRYQELFNDPPDGVPNRNVHHHIPTDQNAPIPSPRLYRLSFQQLEELRTQLTKLLAKKWIRPSASPYGAPVLFAMKKGGKLRMCIDYRALNAITVKDGHAMPLAEDCINQLNGGSIFSRHSSVVEMMPVPM